MTSIVITENNGSIAINDNYFTDTTYPVSYADITGFVQAITDFKEYKRNHSKTMNKYGYWVMINDTHKMFMHTTRTYDNRFDAIADEDNYPVVTGTVTIENGRTVATDFGDIDVVTFSAFPIHVNMLNPLGGEKVEDGTYEVTMNEDTFNGTSVDSYRFNAPDHDNEYRIEFNRDIDYKVPGADRYTTDYIEFGTSDNFVFAYPDFTMSGEIDMVAIPKSVIS